MASSRKLLEAAAEAKAAEEASKRDRREASLIAKLNDTKAKYHALMREMAEVEKRADFLAGLEFAEKDAIKFSQLRTKASADTSAIVVFTDWHIEERVTASTVNNINKHNLEVSDRRIKHVVESVPRLLDGFKEFAKVDQLVVALLGDFISGHIHPDLREENLLSPLEACNRAECRIRDALLYFDSLQRFKSILVPTCHGNHGRTTEKPRSATAHKNNHEWAMYKRLAEEFRNHPRIAFKVSDSPFNMLEVQGHMVRFHHGDTIRFKDAMGGISTSVAKKQHKLDRLPDAVQHNLDVFGHWHQFADHETWVSCGCLIGYNAYAYHMACEYQKPSQTMILMSRKHGKVLATKMFCE